MLKYHCIQENTGIIHSNIVFYFCGNFKCPNNFICSKMNENPESGLRNFDTIFYSYYQIFQIITLDNWTEIMYSIQKVFSNYVWVFFISFAIIGNYFLLNICLVIFKVKFSIIFATVSSSLKANSNYVTSIFNSFYFKILF